MSIILFFFKSKSLIVIRRILGIKIVKSLETSHRTVRISLWPLQQPPIILNLWINNNGSIKFFGLFWFHIRYNLSPNFPNFLGGQWNDERWYGGQDYILSKISL
jgi:hypothetical protein